MQDFGIIAGRIMGVVVLAANKNILENGPSQLDYCWRSMAALGVVYFCIKVLEVPRFTKADEDCANAAQVLLGTDKLAMDVQSSSGSRTWRETARVPQLLQQVG